MLGELDALADALADALRDCDAEGEIGIDPALERLGDGDWDGENDELGDSDGETQQSASASSGRLSNVPQHTVPALL